MSDISQQFDMPWGNCTIYSNGNAVLETPSAILSISSDGNSGVTFKLPVKSVSLDNILDVEEHHIAQTDQETLHTIVFKDGGRFHLSYGSDGFIKRLTGEQISLGISDDGLIKAGAKTSDQSPLHTSTTE